MIYGRFGQVLKLVRRGVAGDEEKFLNKRHMTAEEVMAALERGDLVVVEDAEKVLQLYSLRDLHTDMGSELKEALVEIDKQARAAEKKIRSSMRPPSRKSVAPRSTGPVLIDGRHEPHAYLRQQENNLVQIRRDAEVIERKKHAIEQEIKRATAFIVKHNL